ncbi:MAG: c-type cytochrome [Nitrospirales bacterium]|nr:c-type cytochrome [Nitrospira sp.]MDR4502538.1 c-type cytochrome [Nitrospirales bacterium]
MTQTPRNKNMKIIIAQLGIMIVIHSIAVTSFAQKHEIIEGGRYLYKKYCALCHGPRAQGNGPRADSLKVRPANLTILSQRHGGEFPFWRTYRIIDGREEVNTHGPRDMPVWGLWFQSPGDDVSTETEWADQVRGRIWQLLTYLESIQETQSPKEKK